MTAACDEAKPEDQAMAMVQRALHHMFDVAGGAVTATAETQVQNALHLLRCSRCGGDVTHRIEQISAELFLMLQAKRNGRTNLYASRLLRLKRMALQDRASASLH